MNLSFSSLMIGAEDAKKLGEFYAKVFGKPADMADEENAWWGWSVGAGYVMVGTHSEVKGMSKEPQRLIFNFETKEVQTEFDRIVAAGATVVKAPYSMGPNNLIATLADPEGNYFQLSTPWNN